MGRGVWLVGGEIGVGSGVGVVTRGEGGARLGWVVGGGRGGWWLVVDGDCEGDDEDAIGR